MRARPGLRVAAADDRDRPAPRVERRGVRGPIDADGKAGDDHRAGLGEPLRDAGGEGAAGERRPTRPHHRDGASAPGRVLVAAAVEHGRRRVELAQTSG